MVSMRACSVLCHKCNIKYWILSQWSIVNKWIYESALCVSVVACEKQRAQFANKNGLPKVDLQFTGDCQFVLKQCDSAKCYCVAGKTGKQTFGKLELPLGQDFDCSSELIMENLNIICFNF